MSGPPAGRLAVAAIAVAAVQAFPGTTWLPFVRAPMPALNGIGRPDHVALTFDDGPHPASTPHFLEMLAAQGVHATFFLLGDRVKRWPELTRRIVDEGHEIALHGWQHRYAFWNSPQLVRSLALLDSVTGIRPRWFRPPYGVLSTSALLESRRAGLQPILWTAWGKDWTRRATPDSIVRTLGSGLRGGSTLLLHDAVTSSALTSWHATIGALPLIIGRCREAVLEVGPLADHGIAPLGRRAPV